MQHRKHTMNSYKFTVTATPALIKQWLKQNNCPKAAKSVVQICDRVQFTIEGNVSAVSIINVFDMLGFQFNAVPVGKSDPLPKIWVVA